MAELITANDPQVPYEESNKTSWSIRPDGQSATRYVQVDGKKIRDFCRSVLGYSKVTTVLPPTTLLGIRRFPPERHPLFPNLYARSVEFVRELSVPTPDGPFGSLQYDGNELSVEYTSMPGVRLLGDDQNPIPFGAASEGWRYVRYTKEYGIQSRIIPLAVLLFTATSLVVPEPATIMQSEATIFLTWLQVPSVYDAEGTPQLPGNLAANIAAVEGKMNSTKFRGFPPKTLVCMAPKQELKDQPDGSLCWELTYTLLQRGTKDLTGIPDSTDTDTMDWSRLLNSSGKYSSVYRKGMGIGNSIYPAVEFGKLFTLV